MAPYFQIVSNVKQGDMEKFKSLVTRFQNLFKMDKNLSLVQRLKHTVIKFGLKKINIAYSRISLADIQSKLGLESVEETEQIVAKAIRDGVIEASISHDNQWMQSLQIVDLYSSNEPQQILHKRIQFTMQLHADAVKSLSYPQKDDKKDYGDFGDLDDNKDGDKDLLLSLLEEMGFEGDFDWKQKTHFTKLTLSFLIKVFYTPAICFFRLQTSISMFLFDRKNSFKFFPYKILWNTAFLYLTTHWYIW